MVTVGLDLTHGNTATGVPQGRGRLPVQFLHILDPRCRQEDDVGVELGRRVEGLEGDGAAVQDAHLARADHRADRVQLRA